MTRLWAFALLALCASSAEGKVGSSHEHTGGPTASSGAAAEAARELGQGRINGFLGPIIDKIDTTNREKPFEYRRDRADKPDRTGGGGGGGSRGNTNVRNLI
ncbi:hypothetical protein [Humisphaera borealis]|uniref:Secreted protein n=1 Tax=Humisphaera borealis TaxID=2807512 RepID=A0A7M2WZN7_9BACT|nr:hypothetical protein [Humisphaera borealis]QOV90946.1 hypothetical protein IPV69_06180 [Humisphaera borealis]